MAVFVVEAEKDGEALRTWRNYILPSLPDILGPVLGGDYSAGLVRQESSTGSVVPTIQIQSPEQSEKVKACIRSQIQQLCERNERVSIPVHFSQGSILLLAERV